MPITPNKPALSKKLDPPPFWKVLGIYVIPILLICNTFSCIYTNISQKVRDGTKFKSVYYVHVETKDDFFPGMTADWTCSSVVTRQSTRKVLEGMMGYRENSLNNKYMYI